MTEGRRCPPRGAGWRVQSADCSPGRRRDRSTPHEPLTEQQPDSIIPMTSCDGHAGSGVPGAVFTQVLAAPAASVNIARADPRYRAAPVVWQATWRQRKRPLLGTVHVLLPHMTGITAPDVASPLTSVICIGPESLDHPSPRRSPRLPASARTAARRCGRPRGNYQQALAKLASCKGLAKSQLSQQWRRADQRRPRGLEIENAHLGTERLIGEMEIARGHGYAQLLGVRRRRVDVAFELSLSPLWSTVTPDDAPSLSSAMSGLGFVVTLSRLYVGISSQLKVVIPRYRRWPGRSAR